jgi:hypothetical protein
MPMQTNALSAPFAWSTAAAPRPAKADLETDRPLVQIGAPRGAEPKCNLTNRGAAIFTPISM